MSLSKDQIEKIYSIREKLIITYKAAATEKQRKRISINLKKIENVINDIEEGKEINVSELHIFSSENKSDIKENSKSKDVINYLAKIEVIKLSDSNKDSEMDQIYSFLQYFENNFLSPLGDSYLKLDYNLSKKREMIFAHYEALNHLIKEFTDDLEMLNELKFKEQIETYKSRIEQQKAYLLIKISEFLHELNELLQEIINDNKSGKNSFFNPDERFQTSYIISDKTEFENIKMLDIVKEAAYFVDDFIEILRMPKLFRKNKKR